MGLFKSKDLFGGLIIGPIGTIFDDGPSLIDKIDMLFTDVETEGKKKGYSKAASEYEGAFNSIESEYKKIKELISSQKSTYDKQSNALIEKLEALEQQKLDLEKQVEQKAKAVSQKYDIPISQVRGSLVAGTIISSLVTFDVLGIIYRHKEKKMHEAEQRGYLEAKEIYESKIAKLKESLNTLKNKGNAEIGKLVDMIDSILSAIIEEQTKIAELKILL